MLVTDELERFVAPDTLRGFRGWCWRPWRLLKNIAARYADAIAPDEQDDVLDRLSPAMAGPSCSAPP